MLRLATPVKFGHPENDPVDLVFALAAVDHRSHRRALLDLVRIVRDDSLLHAIRQAPSPEEVSRILKDVSETTDIKEFMPEA
jgi:PTS system ascorbate-specific IIA component